MCKTELDRLDVQKDIKHPINTSLGLVVVQQRGKTEYENIL